MVVAHGCIIGVFFDPEDRQKITSSYNEISSDLETGEGLREFFAQSFW